MTIASGVTKRPVAAKRMEIGCELAILLAAMCFTIYRSLSGGLRYWRLQALGHEIVAQGEGYSRCGGAERAVDLMRSAVDAPLVVLDETV